MYLKRLMIIYPFRSLLSSYILFCLIITIFISLYSNSSFLVSITLTFLYNIFFFVIVFTILLFINLKLITQKKMKLFICFLVFISIILFGKMYKIDEKFYKSLTSISTMQKDLKSGYFKFIGEEYKVKQGRVKDLMTSNLPFVLDDNHEIVILSCQFFSNNCTDVARGSFYNNRNFVEYYDQGNKHYLMFKVISEHGGIVDYTQKYINAIKFKQALVICYLLSVLFMFFQMFFIFTSFRPCRAECQTG